MFGPDKSSPNKTNSVRNMLVSGVFRVGSISLGYFISDGIIPTDDKPNKRESLLMSFAVLRTCR